MRKIFFESDRVEKAMCKAGYEWSEETHQLKKIEQKPAWTEDDEEMFRNIMETCELAEQEHDSSPAMHLLEMQLD